MEQNLRILFEEYAGAYKQVDECVRPKEIGCVMCVEDTERMADIIQEVEALVRKEVIEEVRDLFIDDEVQESKSFSEIKTVIENRGTYNAYDEDGNKLNKKPIIITKGKLF